MWDPPSVSKPFVYARDVTCTLPHHTFSFSVSLLFLLFLSRNSVVTVLLCWRFFEVIRVFFFCMFISPSISEVWNDAVSLLSARTDGVGFSVISRGSSAMCELIRCLVFDSVFGFAHFFARIIWNVWLERRRGALIFSAFLFFGIFSLIFGQSLWSSFSFSVIFWYCYYTCLGSCCWNEFDGLLCVSGDLNMEMERY